MSEPQFKVMFSGQLLPGAQLEDVQANLARLFKADAARIATLFSGKPVEIKRGLSEAQAEQYLKALQHAGALAHKAADLSASLSLLSTDDHPDNTPQSTAPEQAASMTCPKCGQQQARALECSACGIIIDKYVARQTALEQEAAKLNPPTPYATPQAAALRAEPEYDSLRVFSSDGRIGRMRYMAWSMVMAFSLLPIGLLLFVLIKPSWVLATIVGIVGAALFLVLTIMFGIKRLHDLGWSGWLWLLNFVPVIGAVFSLLLLILPGNAGTNLYGPAPPPNSVAVKILFGLWLVSALIGIVAAILLPGVIAGLPTA